jgi:hypothetical protein
VAPLLRRLRREGKRADRLESRRSPSPGRARASRFQREPVRDQRGCTDGVGAPAHGRHTQVRPQPVPRLLNTDMLGELAAHHGLTTANYTVLANLGEGANVLAATLLRDKGAEVLEPWPVTNPVLGPGRAWGAAVRRVPVAPTARRWSGWPRRSSRAPASSTFRTRTTPAGRASARPSSSACWPPSRSATRMPTCGWTSRSRRTRRVRTSQTASSWSGATRRARS